MADDFRVGFTGLAVIYDEDYHFPVGPSRCGITERLAILFVIVAGDCGSKQGKDDTESERGN